MVMDTENPIVKLCIEGSRAEFEGRHDDAAALYNQAWEKRKDDYEACIAAHYLARFQDSPESVMQWNKTALDFAMKAESEKIKTFLPSLYLNLGRDYDKMGKQEEAKNYYNLAIKSGKEISASFGEMIEQAILQGK